VLGHVPLVTLKEVSHELAALECWVVGDTVREALQVHTALLDKL
jgi:hypothetical protein